MVLFSEGRRRMVVSTPASLSFAGSSPSRPPPTCLERSTPCRLEFCNFDVDAPFGRWDRKRSHAFMPNALRGLLPKTRAPRFELDG